MNDPKNKKLIKFVFFDLETNGCAGTGSILNPFHRIIQISAVSGDERFDSLVNPECHIPSESTAIHHVTNEMVKNAPTFKKIFPQFRAFVKKGAKRNTQIVLVAHNALGFDKPVLEKEVKRSGLKSPDNWRYYNTHFSPTVASFQNYPQNGLATFTRYGSTNQSRTRTTH